MRCVQGRLSTSRLEAGWLCRRVATGSVSTFTIGCVNKKLKPMLLFFKKGGVLGARIQIVFGLVRGEVLF